jgi:hypothetical protein
MCIQLDFQKNMRGIYYQYVRNHEHQINDSLQDLILFFKIYMSTRRNFFEIYRIFSMWPQKISPVLS